MRAVKRAKAKGAGVATYLRAVLMAVTVVALHGAAKAQQWTDCGTNNVCHNTGNVGVGTSNPSGKVSVYGGTLDLDGGAGTAPGLRIFERGASPDGYNTNPLLQVGLDQPMGGAAIINNWGNSSNPGITVGTTRGDGAAFQVATGVTLSGGLPATFPSIAFFVGGNGNVGVGTTNPQAGLHIYKSATGSLGGTLVLDNNGSAVGNATAITFADGGLGGGERAQIKAVTESAPYYGAITFLTGLNNLSEKMRVSGNGNVGIGKPNPSVALDVVGDIAATGNISAKYQDVAEWVPSSQKLTAGTVVVLDTNRTNHVLASTKPYDTGVAGVVSASPGVILGEGGGDKVKVATTGRVKVRVDATRLPVHVGDLLVTSDVEGVAMKSIPVDLGGTQIHRPGTIIGKALEPLDKGVGEILVLLSLQ